MPVQRICPICAYIKPHARTHARTHAHIRRIAYDSAYGYLICRFSKDEFFDEYGGLEEWEKAPPERRQDEDGEWCVRRACSLTPGMHIVRIQTYIF